MKGRITITVMVIVTPGSEPPTTPTSVPRNKGSMYFHCRVVTMPLASRSNMGYQPVQLPRGRITDKYRSKTR